MPFTHDYIGSMCLAFAIVLGLLLAVYFVSIFAILRKFLKCRIATALFVLFGVILLHFLPMGSGNTATYMFYSGNVTCIFYYTISGVWGAILVFYAIQRKDKLFSIKDNKLLAGAVVLWIYFAINSDLFHSIIAPVYGGVVILVALVDCIVKSKKSWTSSVIYVVKKYVAWLIIIIMWLGSCWFEINGGRSASMKNDTPYTELLKTTVVMFIDSLKTFNKIWVYLLLLTIIAGALVLLCRYITKTFNDDDREFAQLAMKLMLSTAIVILYLLLLCAKASPGYISSLNVQFSWMFFAVLLEAVCCTYILKMIPITTAIMPLMLVLLFYSTILDGKVYSETNLAGGVDVSKVKALDEYIVESVVEADKAGDTDIELRVPKYDSGDNWPLATYGGGRISNTLYIHGFTTKRMNIIFVPLGSIDDVLEDKDF